MEKGARTYILRSIAEDKWLARIILTGFLFFLGLTVYVVLKDKPLDYYMYLVSARALGSGIDIYAAQAGTYERIAEELGIVTKVTPYGYLTFTAALIYPLSFLPLRPGAAVWIGLSGLAALAAGLLLASFTAEKGKQLLIMLSTVAFMPVLTTMNAGQVNLYVLFTTVLALYLLGQGKNMLAGIILAVSIWLKPFAIALVPLLLWRRRWKALGGFVMGTLLINGYSMAMFGIASALSQFERVLTMVTPSGLYIALTVQNINGLLGRLTTGISEPTGQLLYLIVAGLIGVITVAAIVCRPQMEHLEREAALLIAATHLIVPLTWYHHLTMLIIPLAFVIIYWEGRILAGASLVLLTGIILTNFHGIFWKQLSNLPPSLSNFPVLTNLLIWGLVLKGLWGRPAGPSRREEG